MPGTPIHSILLILSKTLCLFCVSVAKTEILILLFSLVHPVKASPGKSNLIQHFWRKKHMRHHQATKSYSYLITATKGPTPPPASFLGSQKSHPLKPETPRSFLRGVL